MRPSTLAAIACAAVAGASHAVAADPAAGTKLRTDAEALAAKHDFAGAAATFRAAYAADPRPELVCDIGVAYYKLPDLPRAQRFLKQCIDAGASLDRGFLDHVTSALRTAEDKLAKGDFTPVDFLVQPATAVITVAGWTDDDPLTTSRRAWLPFGTYTLTIHAEGFVDKTVNLAASAHAIQLVGVALDRAPPVAPVVETPPTPPPQPVVSQPLPVPAPPPRVQAQAAASSVPAIAATAVTGLVAIAGAAAYVSAHGRASDAAGAQTQADYDQIVSSVHTRQDLAFALWGLTGAGALASVYLWHRAAPVEVAATPTPTGAAVSIRGRF